MKILAVTLASSVLLVGISLNAASAAPVVTAPGLTLGEPAATEVAYRKGHHHARESHRAHRRHHIRNRMMHGDPNARNPERPGYAQQRGSTSGGPHY